MVRFEKITSSGFEAYHKHTVDTLADATMRSKDLSESQARAAAESSFQRLLSQGIPDPPGKGDQFLYELHDEKGQVGFIHFGIQRDAKRPYLYLWDIVISTEFRGRGYAKQALRLMEEAAKGLGIERTSLNVFGHNEVARRLYEGMGYRVSSQIMSKELDSSGE